MAQHIKERKIFKFLCLLLIFPLSLLLFSACGEEEPSPSREIPAEQPEQPPEAPEAAELPMVQPFRNSSENEFEPVPLPESLQGTIEPRSYQLAGNEGSNSREGISIAAADVAFPAEEVLLRFYNENEHPAMSGLAYRLYAWVDAAWVEQPFSPGYDSFRQLGISIEPGESAYMLCLLRGEAFAPDNLELREGALPPGRYLLEVQVSSDMEQAKESRRAYYADFSIIEE